MFGLTNPQKFSLSKISRYTLSINMNHVDTGTYSVNCPPVTKGKKASGLTELRQFDKRVRG